MEINYIILAHRSPDQLFKLVNALENSNVNFYIHIDKNQDISLFKSILQNSQNTYFLKDDEREPCSWGGFGILKATLNAINRIINDKRSGYVVLLSGQCYPIKSKEYIHSFFINNYGCNFIKGSALPNKWPLGGLNRIYDYTFFRSCKKGDFITIPPIFSNRIKYFPIRKIIRKPYFLCVILKNLKVILTKRKLPFNLIPYGGAQWWALPFETIQYISEYINKYPIYIDFFKFSLASDEIFFHTLIFNNINHLKCQNIKNTLTFDKWDSHKSNSPAILNTNDFASMQDPSFLFARKFDTEMNPAILEIIDEQFLKK